MTHAKESANDLLPLAGVRVVSVAPNVPGPVCASRLQAFGASVLKIEPPEALGGDPLAQYAPAYYTELHRAIEVRSLNLKLDTDRATMRALLSNTDVLITAQRDAALVRMELDWARVSADFATLSCVAIVGAVAADSAGHDLTYITRAGLATPPVLPATLVADLAGAERAVSAVFAVLRMAQITGRGHRMIVSLEEAASAFAPPRQHGLTADGGPLSGVFAGYRYYQTSDGWIALAAL